MIGYFKNLSNVKKLVVYIGSSVITGAVDAGLVPVQYEHYVQLSVFFLTSIGIYAAANKKATAASATVAAAEAATTVASGQLPSLDLMQSELDDLLPKHAAPVQPLLPPVPAPVTAPASMSAV